MTAGQGSVAQVLHRHGVRGSVAAAVEAIGVELQERTRQANVEFAAMVDAATGERLGDVLRGDTRSVDITDHLRGMAAEHGYVQIHSHPAGSSFSAQDAIVFATVDGLQVSVVVGRESIWYVLSREPGRPLPAPGAIFTAFRRTVDALRPRYAALVWAGHVSQQAAWREHTHEVWQTIAPPLGLRYDRIETA